LCRVRGCELSRGYVCVIVEQPEEAAHKYASDNKAIYISGNYYLQELRLGRNLTTGRISYFLLELSWTHITDTSDLAVAFSSI